MIVVPVKEGENIEKALKKFKRKFEKTGVIKELRNRHATSGGIKTFSLVGRLNSFFYIRSVSQKLRSLCVLNHF